MLQILTIRERRPRLLQTSPWTNLPGFIKKLVKYLQNFLVAHVPLAYYWRFPDNEIMKNRRHIYYDQGISSFVYAVKSYLPWFYHYHNATGDLGLRRIPDAFHVGGGMLRRGEEEDALSTVIAKFRPIAKYNSILNYLIEPFVNVNVTTYAVRMISAFPADDKTTKDSNGKDVEMADASPQEADDRAEKIRNRGYLKVYVQLDAKICKGLGHDSVFQQGRTFTINFYLKGVCERSRSSSLGGEIYAITYRPVDSQVVRSFDSIEEALKQTRFGAYLLTGCVSENYPTPEDPTTYPNVLPKASHDGKKAIPRTEIEIAAYDKFKLEFDSLNTNCKWNLDKPQREAVLLGTKQNLVNIVQGPPGTGKRMTLAAAAIVHVNVADDKVLMCTPSNPAVDGIALMIQKMLPLSWERHILREHIVGAEHEFALLSEEDEKQFVPKSKGDAEMLVIEQLESMLAENINTNELTEAALNDTDKLHPKHFHARSMSTAAYVRALAVRKTEIYGSPRHPSGLLPEDKGLLDASNTLLSIGTEFNAMPGGKEKQASAKRFNEAMRLARIEQNTLNQRYVSWMKQRSVLKQTSSAFERLRECGVPVYRLTIQHRMTPTCNVLTNSDFYGGKITFIKRFFHGEEKDDTIVYPEVVFVNMQDSISYKDQHSPSSVNSMEASMAAHIICSLLAHNPELKPSANWMPIIANEENWTKAHIPDMSQIVYDTVHSSQGREVDISIVSFGACCVKDFNDQYETVDTRAWDAFPYISPHVRDSALRTWPALARSSPYHAGKP
ncbi:uncharacterized protein A1O9_00351 [Exophiala aquamarina CBS 119918]|uniref:DNA2/NAM7 helicase helicase domain-containing protein n=1 Tax=Exophiala aquamarina CBS 119918 TaxID=1182545 RepID=A0A072PQK7_9EURO|nr:uncharacterized protein A1O9_00351 [Exophiala aquamarina CBS 119918]KEF62379.1 hypothetical protein A1O9_00351 [Exophiala aquamarina CBS 119918]